MTKETKLCIDCKYCMREFKEKCCGHLSSMWESSPSVVDGKSHKRYGTCEDMRKPEIEEMPTGRCGLKAKYFKQRKLSWFDKFIIRLFGEAYR